MVRNQLRPSVADIDPSEPFEFPEFNPGGHVDISTYKYLRERAARIYQAKQSPMLLAKNADGRALYQITDGGSLVRTFKVSPRVRRLVLERDGSCVLCDAGPPFQVDHIVRYVDGGSNEPDNLRVLCVPCHNKRGGRP